MIANPLGSPMGDDQKLEATIGDILDLAEAGFSGFEHFEGALVRMFAFELWDTILGQDYSPGIAIWDGDE